jgi:glycerophosphoryl diester phosphodiesterase
MGPDEAVAGWSAAGRPLVVGHRGASGYAPENTFASFELALAQGADIVEPDLVPSADGILFARHDHGLARSTDIARRPEFAADCVDGDWPCDRLRADQIDRLHAMQPRAKRSTEFDGRFLVPRWSAVLEWAARAARMRGVQVTLYPELQHPQEFAARGVDPVEAFIESVRVPVPGVEVWVQCFDARALERVHEATGLRCCLGLGPEADWKSLLRGRGDYLAGVVAAKQLLSEDFVATAHGDGLRVDAWTFRDDQVGPGHPGIDAELTWAMRLGVDGLFCDFPQTAVRARSLFV